MNADTVAKRTLSHRIAGASPIAKLLAWMAATFVSSFAAQILLCGVGLQDQLFVSPPRWLTLIVALTGLTVLAVADRRPATDYGLALPRYWGRQLGVGLAIGFGGLGGWYALLHATNVLRVEPAFRWGMLLDLLPIAFSALIAGFSLQIVLSGYVHSIFRERHGSVLAIVVPAVALPILYRIDTPAALFDDGQWRLVVWLLLFQMLAGVLRLRLGHIAVAAGLIAGAMVLRRALRLADPWLEIANPTAAAWLCPEGDVRYAPAMWAVIAIAITILAWMPRTHIAGSESRNTRIPVSAKRLYPFAMPMSFASLGVLLQCLWGARGRVTPHFVPRAAAALVLSALNTVLSLPERLVTPLLLRRRILDPVFVVGVHRSGTTHLHNLLALDPNLATARHHQVLNPLGALFCGLPLLPLLAAFAPWRRPMDNMMSHIFSPAEEEFGIANLCIASPYWGWVFPRRAPHFDRYLLTDTFPTRDKPAWRRAYRQFLGKVVLWSGKRPVLKNPCNTGRIDLLLEVFPDARFVHIHRDPHDVYRSNLHLAREGQCLFQLQDPITGRSYADRFLSNYAAMEASFYRAAATLAPNRFVDVRFEDLEADPIGQVERIHSHLELPFTGRFRDGLTRYVRSVADYRKNRFAPIDEATRRAVARHTGFLARRWGYTG